MLRRSVVSTLGVIVTAALLAACQPASQKSSTADSAEELFAAARTGDLDGIRRLVESGTPVDTGGWYGSAALLVAARAGHLEVVRYLLEQGADPNRGETFFNSSPLDNALGSGHVLVAILLLENGADDREAALEFAIREGFPELARAAVSSGPLYESRLAALRAGSAELDPALGEILAEAESRPDPDPPTLSAEELQPFTGLFEGWSSDTRAEVTAGPGGLLLSLNTDEPRALIAVAEKTFRSEDGGLETFFFGRAGTVEGFVLRRAEGPPESLRRSVAEPVGPSALRSNPTIATAPSEPTVNWPGFRGDNASGIGDGIDTPTTWDLDTGESVLWQVELPGLGNSSPVVWGDRVFVTTAAADGAAQKIRTGLTGDGSAVDEQVEHSWRVIALDKWTGERVWQTEVGRGMPVTRRHFKASQANSTPVTDGRRVVVVFPTVGLACLDGDGKLLWKHELGGLNAGAPGDPDSHWGFASSPVLYGSRVILQVDVHEGPYLAAWDLDSGRQLWRTERDVVPSWATPAVLRGPSGDELIVNGSTIHGYDPETGRELWSLGPNSELVIATPVVSETVAYVSAGYPPVKPIYAVRAGTRGALDVDPAVGHERLLWSHSRGGAYMPTPLLYRGLFYVVHHNGRLVAYEAESGAPIYKSRFSGTATVTGSPVAVNGKLYVPTEEGLVYVLEAATEHRELAVNDFGEPLMATPAVSEGVLLFRTPSRLVAIADRAEGAGPGTH